MRNIIAAFCLVIVSFVVYYYLGGMQNATDIPYSSDPLKQIGFYHYFSGTLSGGISEMVDEINSSQTRFNISARALDHEAFKSMIHTTLDKQNPPQLFSYWAGARVQNLLDKDKLAIIDDLWEEEHFGLKFSQSVIDAASTYGGHKYLVPISQFIVVFFFNKDIFSQHHLVPPHSWDEFLSVCRTLKQKGITPIALGSKERWPAQFWLDYLLLRTQGIEYRNQLMHGRVCYTEPPVKEVYRIWSKLLQKGYFNENANQLDWTGATQMVSRQKAAMTLMGTWATQVLKDDGSCEKIENCFGFFPFPRMDKRIPKVALGPIDGIVLSKYSTSQQFAKQALTYFAGANPQKIMSKGSGGISPSLEVPLSFYSPFKKRIIEEIKSSQAWAFNYDLATPPEVAEIGMNSFKELIEFPDQYERILDNVEAEARPIFADKLRPVNK